MRAELGLKRTSPSSEREEGVTCSQPRPSETRAAPTSCACGEPSSGRDRGSPPVTHPVAALLRTKKDGGIWIRDKPSRWGHPKGSHREDQVLEFYCDTSAPRSVPGQGTGLLRASLILQGAGTWVAVNILEILSLFDTCPIFLTNTAALSREALAASGIGS